MADNNKLSKEELDKVRLANLHEKGLKTRRANAEKRKSGMQPGTGDEGRVTQEGAPGMESNPQPTTHNPQPSAAMEEPVMPVPDMAQVSPNRVEPKYEEHVLQSTQGAKPKDATSPPLQDGSAPTQPIEPSFDGNIGGTNIYEGPNSMPPQGSAPPPMPDAGGGSGMPPGGGASPIMPGEQDPGGAMPQPGNPQGNTITREQAKKMFDEAVKKYNYFMKNQVGEWVAIKPGKIEELQSAPKAVKDEVEASILTYNNQNKEALILNAEDIGMLEEPAIAVLQEEGVALSNGQLLMIAAIQVGLKKIEVLVKIIYYSKAVKEQIREAVRNGVNEMRGIYNETTEVLNKAKQFATDQEKRFQKMEDDFRHRQEEFEQKVRNQNAASSNGNGASTNGHSYSNAFKKEEHVPVAKTPEVIVSPLGSVKETMPQNKVTDIQVEVIEPETVVKDTEPNTDVNSEEKPSPHNE